MIAVDTNIFVRYAVKDDHRLAKAATEFLKKNNCIILKTVLLELAWVLSSQAGYNLSRSQVAERHGQGGVGSVPSYTAVMFNMTDSRDGFTITKRAILNLPRIIIPLHSQPL